MQVVLHSLQSDLAFLELCVHVLLQVLGLLLDVCMDFLFGPCQGLRGCDRDFVLENVLSKCEINERHAVRLDLFVERLLGFLWHSR